MAERATLARPYARAAFELAQEQGRLADWSRMLELTAAIAADEQLAALVGDPRVTPEDLSGLVIAVAGDGLDAGGANLVRLLAEAGRLPLLVEVVALFEDYRAQAEAITDVEVTSATEVPQAQRDAIAESLRAKLGTEVRLHFQLDPELIGGAVIRAGDLVIDGSVRERLQQLSAAMTG